MSEAINDMTAFTLLTDSVLQLIKVDPRPELKEVSTLLQVWLTSLSIIVKRFTSASWKKRSV